MHPTNKNKRSVKLGAWVWQAAAFSSSPPRPTMPETEAVGAVLLHFAPRFLSQ